MRRNRRGENQEHQPKCTADQDQRVARSDSGTKQDEPSPQRTGFRGGVEAGVEVREAEDTNGCESREYGPDQHQSRRDVHHCSLLDSKYRAKATVDKKPTSANAMAISL